MDHIQQLEQTKTAFAHHQSTNNRRHYADALKQEAVSLLKHYSIKTLSHALNISGKTLRNWQAKDCRSTPSSPIFLPIALNAKPIKSTDTLSGSWILKLPHQLELILPIASIHEAAQLMTSLIKEMSKCSI